MGQSIMSHARQGCFKNSAGLVYSLLLSPGSISNHLYQTNLLDIDVSVALLWRSQPAALLPCCQGRRCSRLGTNACSCVFGALSIGKDGDACKELEMFAVVWPVYSR